MKENVIVGHKIPAGTGMRDYQDLIVGSKVDYQKMTEKNKEAEETIESLSNQ